VSRELMELTILSTLLLLLLAIPNTQASEKPHPARRDTLDRPPPSEDLRDPGMLCCSVTAPPLPCQSAEATPRSHRPTPGK
jgi:hypothetical protein